MNYAPPQRGIAVQEMKEGDAILMRPHGLGIVTSVARVSRAFVVVAYTRNGSPRSTRRQATTKLLVNEETYQKYLARTAK